MANFLLFGISNQEQLIIPATFIFISSVILAAIIKLLNIWTTGRLSAGIGSELSYSAFRRTLYQPYSVHLSRNSSDFVASISIHLKTTISVLQSILSMISSIIVMLCILIALFIVDWKVALTIVFVFGFIYLIIRLSARKKLDSNSRIIVEYTREQLKHLNEGLGAIRDVILAGTQNHYLNIYREKDYKIWLLTAQNNILSIFPRYVLEAIGLILIASISLGLIQLKRYISNNTNSWCCCSWGTKVTTHISNYL